MSTQDPNDLRDPRFDAAWRAASREEPSAALDDAIRAAARREVRAGPQSDRVPKPLDRAALRPQRWWMPLAAAATIGAIAIGVLQLANPDKVVAPATDKAIVSDMPAPSSSAPPAASTAPVPASEPRSAASEGVIREEAPSAPVAAPAPAPPPPAKSRRKDTAVPFPAQKPRSADTEATPQRATAEKDRQAGALDAAKPAAPAEPFPADALKQEAKEDAASLPQPAAPPANAGAPESAAGKLSATPAAREAATRDSARVDTPAVAQSPAPAAPAPMRRMQSAEAVRSTTTTNNFAKGAADVRAKVVPPLAVPDWIALIRKLRDEGKIDEAAKELTAFRAAHADHADLLPPDLRDWKQPTQ